MRWETWLRDVGLPAPESPDVTSIIVALAVVGAIGWIGWFLGRRLGHRIAALVRRWTGRTDDFGSRLARAIVRYGLIIILLTFADNAMTFSPIGLVIIAVAQGLAVAMLAYRITTAAGLGDATAAVLSLVIFVATIAGTLGGLQPLTTALQGVALTVGKNRISLLGVVNFVVIASILYLLARLANRILNHSIGRMHALDVSQRALVQKLAGLLVVIVALLLGVDLLGIDLTALTVFSGAAGLAVGFGLQKTFGNLIAGLILLMDRSVKPGDVIVVGDTFGAVTKIGVRAVSVVTRDGKEHLIPNEQLMTEAVENWSYSSRNVRIRIPVGVSYASDIALAQKLMIEAAHASPRVLPNPEPNVWLTGYGDSSVEHEILVWITDPESGVGNVQSEVLNHLWRAFKENGIEIPFPQRDLHIRSGFFRPPPQSPG